MDKYYVYRHLDSNNKIIYVGKTNNIKNRQRAYLTHQAHTCEEHYNTIIRIEYIELDSKEEMDKLEIYYIDKWKPRYNKINNIHPDEIINIHEWLVYFDKRIERLERLEKDNKQLRNLIKQYFQELIKFKNELINLKEKIKGEKDV